MNISRSGFNSIIFSVTLAATLCPLLSYAQQKDELEKIPPKDSKDVTIDLRVDSSGTKLTDKTGNLSILVVGLIPSKYYDYQLKTEYSFHTFAPLKKPNDATALSVAPAAGARSLPANYCSEFKTAVEEFRDAVTASDADSAYQKAIDIYNKIEGNDGRCNNEIKMFNENILKTYKETTILIHDDYDSKISVLLGGGTPVLSLDVVPLRKQWISSYGFGFTNNRDDAYHSLGNATDGFVVTKQNDEQMLSYSAMLMFTYPMADIGKSGLEWGFSGGIGASQQSVSAFAGVGFVFAKNIILSLGASFQEFEVLNGTYEEGQNIGSTKVDSTALNDKTFKPALSLILSYNFGTGGSGGK